MSFPDSLLLEIPTPIAAELLTRLEGEPVSAGLSAWLGFVRGDVANALAQSPMLGTDDA